MDLFDLKACFFYVSVSIEGIVINSNRSISHGDSIDPTAELDLSNLFEHSMFPGIFFK